MSNPTELPGLDRLEALADKADEIATDLYGDRYMQGSWSRVDLNKEQDDFITAFTPAVVKKLIALARRAQPEGEALEGRMVSVDVSTGEDDALHRIYAELTGETAGDWITLIAIESSRNFGKPEGEAPQAEMCKKCHSTAAIYARNGICSECGGNEFVARPRPASQHADSGKEASMTDRVDAENYRSMLRVAERNGYASISCAIKSAPRRPALDGVKNYSIHGDAIVAQQAAAPGSLDLMNADEMAALRRFDETCQDVEGYDVPKTMMQRLAAIGVVRRTSGSYYETTEFGLRVLDQPAPSAPGTPEAPKGGA